MIDLAALWHDPRGPEPLPLTGGDGDLAVGFVRKGYVEQIDRQIMEAARAAGLDERMIALILGRTSQG